MQDNRMNAKEAGTLEGHSLEEWQRLLSDFERAREIRKPIPAPMKQLAPMYFNPTNAGNTRKDFAMSTTTTATTPTSDVKLDELRKCDQQAFYAAMNAAWETALGPWQSKDAFINTHLEALLIREWDTKQLVYPTGNQKQYFAYRRAQLSGSVVGTKAPRMFTSRDFVKH
jgi:hypothetical protein